MYITIMIIIVFVNLAIFGMVDGLKRSKKINKYKAKKMLEYCSNNQIGLGNDREKELEMFEELSKQLKPFEKVNIAFLGWNDGSMNECSYVVTGNRILWSSEKKGGSIYFNELHDARYKTETMDGCECGIIQISSQLQDVVIGNTIEKAEKIYKKLKSHMKI